MYEFETQTRFFTDFMQSQMSRRHNQIIAPHNVIMPEHAVYHFTGRELWK